MASECIRTTAAKYGCKILELYEYEKCKYYPKNTSSYNIKHRRLSSQSLSAFSEQHMFQN